MYRAMIPQARRVDVPARVQAMIPQARRVDVPAPKIAAKYDAFRFHARVAQAPRPDERARLKIRA